jgi:hypothetical protein
VAPHLFEKRSFCASLMRMMPIQNSAISGSPKLSQMYTCAVGSVSRAGQRGGGLNQIDDVFVET